MRNVNYYIENPEQYIDDLVEESLENFGVHQALFALDSHSHTQICDRREFEYLSEDDKIHWCTMVTIKSTTHCLSLFKHPDYMPLAYHDIHYNLILRLVNVYTRNHQLNSNNEFFTLIEKLLIDIITSLSEVIGVIHVYLSKTIRLNKSVFMVFPSVISHLINVMKFEYYPVMLPDIVHFMGGDTEAMRTVVKSINRYKLTNGKSDIANSILEHHEKKLEPFQNI